MAERTFHDISTRNDRALISAAGSVPYILAVIRGTAPAARSRGVRAVLAGAMTVSAFIEGAMASAGMTAITFTVCYGNDIGLQRRTGGINRVDMVCLVGAVLGITSLAIFKSPLIALTVSVAVDIIAFIPTLVHAWTSPYEESLTVLP